jgi:steroid delta-isomerase-like uncharacterized protein
MSAENKALARRLVEEALNAGRLEVVDELVASDFVEHDPSLPEEVRGPAGVKELIAGYRAAFPDIHITIEDQIADGDYVVSRWSGTGTHQGELMGMPATGKQATVTGITIDRIADGRIAESWDNWDTLGMMQQLGAIPAPAMA